MSILRPQGVMPDTILAGRVKEAFDKKASVRMSGVLQLVSSGHLIVAVPAGLVQGVFDALHEPGISPALSIEGTPTKSGIVVMTPEEVESVGGPDAITERGKTFFYSTSTIEETPARNLAGVSTCFHLVVKSPELMTLRKSYGLAGKIEGDSDFSIVVAVRKSGVLAANAKSKSTQQVDNAKLPDWAKP